MPERGYADKYIFSFQWPVDTEGYQIVLLSDEERSRAPHEYEWITLNAKTGKPVIEGLEEMRVFAIQGKGGPPRYYRPQDVKEGVHRLLARSAQTDDLEKGILDFANEFGLLGNFNQTVGPDGTPKIEKNKEAANFFIRLRWSVQKALGMIDEAASIEWAKRLKKIKFKPGEEFLKAHKWFHGNWIPETKSWYEPIEEEDRIKFQIRHVPKNLQEFILCMIDEEIAGGQLWKFCEVCRKPFEIGERGKRRDKIYCSRRCQNKADYQKRKRKAAQEK